MHDYTLMVHFRADNALIADNIIGDLQETLIDVISESAQCITMQVARGNSIDERVVADGNSIADEATEILNAGLNNSPLPEGFPTL